MRRDELKRLLRGVIVATPTPFDDAFEVDYGRMAEMTEWWVENGLVEGKAAHTGLICNAGHPDILTLREAPRKRAFDWKIDYPEPFVPRNRTYEVSGRVDSLGNEITPLSDQDVRDAAAYFKKCEVEAIAVIGSGHA